MRITRMAMSLMLTFLAVIVCSNKCAEGLKILAIFPLNGKSHFVMCERLAKGLAEKGHQLDVYSHFPSKKPIPNYTDYSLEGSLPAVINNVTYETTKVFNNVNIKLMVDVLSRDICGLMGHPVFQDLFNKLKKEQPYDLVITEAFVMNCHLAWGRFLNIPMVAVVTSELIDWFNEPLGNPINLAAIPGRWTGLLHPMSFWEKLKNILMYNVGTKSFEYFVGMQDKYVEKYFGPSYLPARDLPRDIDLMLVNSHFALEGVRPYVPAIIPVAGLHIVDDGTKLPNDVQKWLDDSKNGCIYVSFGSMVRLETFPKEVLDGFYSTFKKLAPVRVLMKIAKPEELPPGLPSNVMTQTWFSQIQVLKHKNVKAFVTHGGLMSTQESIYAGVPLVGISLFGDQHINVMSQVRRQIATSVPVNNITEATLYLALKEVLDNPIYQKNAEKLSRKFFDRPMSPLDTATYWVEYIARHGKGALRSPVVDMPWWQANLLDVYGFILFVIIAALYTLRLILKKIMSLIRPKTLSEQRNKTKKNQ